jgi:hypothetical protein
VHAEREWIGAAGLSLLAGLGSAWLAPPAGAATFAFELLAQSGQEVPLPLELGAILLPAPQPGSVSVDGAGAVAFAANGATAGGIFVHDGALELLDGWDDVDLPPFYATTSIAGARVASREVPGGDLFVGYTVVVRERPGPGPGTRIAPTLEDFADPGPPSSNASGAVGFCAEPLDPVLAIADGGPAEVALGDGSETFFGDPALNDAGQLAVVFEGPGVDAVVRREPDGDPTPIADGDDVDCPADTRCFPGPVALDASGGVYFVAVFERDEATETGVFLAAGDPPALVADTGGPFSGFPRLRVNAAGALVFEAELDGGGTGIFTGPDAEADRVIGVGDELFASTVESLSLGGIDDAGRIAFEATLADGRGVVARAVPEPAGLAAAAALASLALYARGSRRRGGYATPRLRLLRSAASASALATHGPVPSGSGAKSRSSKCAVSVPKASFLKSVMPTRAPSAPVGAVSASSERSQLPASRTSKVRPCDSRLGLPQAPLVYQLTNTCATPVRSCPSGIRIDAPAV